MAEGRGRDEWGRMSSLLALVANVNRDPRRTRAFKPADFNPYEVRAAGSGGIPLTKKNMRLLKQVFVDRKGDKP
jgi:hypothetical protein